MANIDVMNSKNEKVGVVELEEAIFGAATAESVVHEALIMQLACERQGTASTKTKGLVSGGGKKPWRQKGTGRARSGSSRSPVWKGGGVVFGPRPRSYAYSIPRKKRRQALSSILGARLQESAIMVLDDFGIDAPKTKTVSDLLKKFEISGKVMILADCCGSDSNLFLAARNIPNVFLHDAESISVYDLLNVDKILASKSELTRRVEIWS